MSLDSFGVPSWDFLDAAAWVMDTMSSSATLVVPGTAAPKGSRNTGQRKDGTIFTRPASKREKEWTEAVAYAAMASRPRGKAIDPPYRVRLEFSLPRPQKPSYEWPTRGDLDKLERCCLDGLTKGELITDDRHIVKLASSKRFVTPGTEHVRIEVLHEGGSNGESQAS